MPEHDPLALDEVEKRFWADIWDTSDAAAAAEHGVVKRNFGRLQATLVEDLPSGQLPNLVLGAGEEGALDSGELEDAVEWADALGVGYSVPVTPSAPEAASVEAWLETNGFSRGYAWMKFVRDASPADPDEASGVGVRELAAGEGLALGTIAASGFRLPDWAAGLFAGLPGRDGWRCYVASVGGADAACAAMLIADGIAQFGIAATLEGSRGRGCQLALLRRRIADAAAAGCHTLFVETGERVDDKPSGSYRNILRAGFAEAYLRPNWRRAG